MLGKLIDTLDDPNVAGRLVAALDSPSLLDRLMAAAQAADQTPADYLASSVRNFLEIASDDHWVQLVGIMSRADDPGLAVVRAILDKVVPKQDEAA